MFSMGINYFHAQNTPIVAGRFAMPIDDRSEGIFDFDTHEEYEAFRQRSERIYGEGSYSQAGKHTNNVMIALPMTEEEYEQATGPDGDSPLVDNSDYQKRREIEIRDEVLEAFGSPPKGMEIEVGTDYFSKGASGLPGQFLEFLVQSGGVYGGARAFYDIGRYIITLVQRVRQDRIGTPSLNKSGVVAVCAVDLVENRGLEEYELVSAIEIMEGHLWVPTIDGRDLYCVTFTDHPYGYEAHIYLTTSHGAILNYKRFSLSESPVAEPWFIEQEDSS